MSLSLSLLCWLSSFFMRWVLIVCACFVFLKQYTLEIQGRFKRDLAEATEAMVEAQNKQRSLVGCFFLSLNVTL